MQKCVILRNFANFPTDFCSKYVVLHRIDSSASRNGSARKSLEQIGRLFRSSNDPALRIAVTLRRPEIKVETCFSNEFMYKTRYKSHPLFLTRFERVLAPEVCRIDVW